jgi:hypothetical protein
VPAFLHPPTYKQLQLPRTISLSTSTSCSSSSNTGRRGPRHLNYPSVDRGTSHRRAASTGGIKVVLWALLAVRALQQNQRPVTQELLGPRFIRDSILEARPGPQVTANPFPPALGSTASLSSVPQLVIKIWYNPRRA